jgi:hypothetical protein
MSWIGQKEAKIKEDRGDDEESTELNDGHGKKRKNKKDVDGSEAGRKEEGGSVVVGNFGGDINIYCHICHNNNLNRKHLGPRPPIL